MSRLHAAVLVATVILVACRARRGDVVTDAAPRDPAPASSAPDASDVRPTLPPLGGVPWMTTVELEDGSYAHVAVPLGATRAMPIVVGVHGAADHADWACSEWRATVGGGAWVVCPRGTPDPRAEGALVWSSAAQITRNAARAVAAVRARFGLYVADGPAVYGAWSQGATLAGEVMAGAARDAHDGVGLAYDRVVLVEGGYGGVDARAMARSFAKGGVGRALVCCASTACRKLAVDLRGAGPAVGLEVHVVDVGLRGHVFDKPVFEAIAGELPWLLAGDARWTGLLR